MDGGIRIFGFFIAAVMALSSFMPLPGIRHDLDPTLVVVVVAAAVAIAVEFAWYMATRIKPD